MKFKPIYLLFVLPVVFTNSNAQWQQTFGMSGTWGGSVTSLAIYENNIYAGTWNGGIFESKDNGQSWESLNAGKQVYCIINDSSAIYVGDYVFGILVSTDKGVNWTEANTGLMSKKINNVAIKNDSVYAATSNGLFSAHRQDMKWHRLNSNMQYPGILSVATNSAIIFIGGLGIYNSADYGKSWTNCGVGYENVFVDELFFDGNDFYAGIENWYGLIKSKDFGKTWTPINYFYSVINSFLKVNNTLFVGSKQGVNYSIDDGTNWKPFNDGLNTDIYKVQNLAVNHDFMFAATSAGIFRRPLSDLITDINTKLVPAKFLLSQNYPNPFNPTSTIKYQLPITEHVTLKVYDLLGREIITLVNEEKMPGNYEVKFDGSNLSSGVFFYIMQAGSFSQTKKFVLLK